MKTFAWVALSAFATATAVACSGDESKGKDKADASGDGATATGGTTGEESGSGGSTGGMAKDAASGGTTDSGGTTEDAAPPDTTPPTFAGIKDVVDGDEGKVVVSWDAASDDRTDPASIVYVVYRASTLGGEDFSGSRRCGDPAPDSGTGDATDLPCFAVAPAGATKAIVRDATPGHEYYYVVRAVDAAGNDDGNSKESVWLSADLTAPEFTGVRGLTALSPTSISVRWGSAYDLGTPDSSLKFNVWASPGGAPDPDTDPPTLTTQPGEHTAILTGLTPSTTYSVIVRAVDDATNHDTNTRTLKITTPEGNPPAFAGARRAAATGTTVRVFWTPATDDNTDQDVMVYDVYQSLRTHAQDFSKPTYTSDPGASSITLPDLQPGITYYFVVRARDSAGNQDDNIVQVQVTTGGIPDTKPPNFTGLSSLTSDSPTTLTAKWISAADDTSLNENLTYLVYVGATSQLPLSATATPTLSIKGATQVTIGGLPPSSTRYVIVRVKDEAGNVQTANDIEKNAQTLALPVVTVADGGTTTDTTPPTGTDPTVTKVFNPATRLQVSWAAATDDVDSAANLRYHLCVSTVEADCIGTSFATHIATTTALGATSATLSYLTPRTNYFVILRAEDRSGNIETLNHSIATKTATSWKANVAELLFDRCIACHDYDKPSGIVSASSTFLVNDGLHCNDSQQGGQSIGCVLRLVDPGFPEYSYIYRKLNPVGLTTAPFSATVPNVYGGSQMPRDTSAKFTGEEDDTLRDWIAEGAVSN